MAALRPHEEREADELEQPAHHPVEPVGLREREHGALARDAFEEEGERDAERRELRERDADEDDATQDHVHAEKRERRGDHDGREEGRPEEPEELTHVPVLGSGTTVGRPPASTSVSGCPKRRCICAAASTSATVPVAWRPSCIASTCVARRATVER